MMIKMKTVNEKQESTFLKEKGKVWLPGLTRSCLLGCEHSGSDLINATFSLAFLCNGDGNDDDNFCMLEQDQIVSVVLNK